MIFEPLLPQTQRFHPLAQRWQTMNSKQEYGDACEVPIGQFIRFFHAGPVGKKYKTRPHQNECAQRPKQQLPHQGRIGPSRTAHRASSFGMK